jgi:hypothetical protein
LIIQNRLTNIQYCATVVSIVYVNLTRREVRKIMGKPSVTYQPQIEKVKINALYGLSSSISPTIKSIAIGAFVAGAVGFSNSDLISPFKEAGVFGFGAATLSMIYYSIFDKQPFAIPAKPIPQKSIAFAKDVNAIDELVKEKEKQEEEVGYYEDDPVPANDLKFFCYKVAVEKVDLATNTWTPNGESKWPSEYKIFTKTQYGKLKEKLSETGFIKMKDPSNVNAGLILSREGYFWAKYFYSTSTPLTLESFQKKLHSNSRLNGIAQQIAYDYSNGGVEEVRDENVLVMQ